MRTPIILAALLFFVALSPLAVPDPSPTEVDSGSSGSVCVNAQTDLKTMVMDSAPLSGMGGIHWHGIILVGSSAGPHTVDALATQNNGWLATHIGASTNVALTSLDLTDPPTVNRLMTQQRQGQLGGTLHATGGVATGGNLILRPANLASTLTALNIPANVTVTNQDFTSGKPVDVSLTDQSTTRQVIIGGTMEFVSSSTRSGGVMSISSTHSDPVLSVSSSGLLSSDSSLTITTVGAEAMPTAAENWAISTPIVKNNGTIRGGEQLNFLSTGDLWIDNTGGRLKAPSVQVRDATFAAKANTTIAGGDLLVGSIKINSGTGKVSVNVGELAGPINVWAHEAHVTAATPTLFLGTIALTGDPTFYNTAGNVTLSGSITVTEPLAILASGNITTTTGAGVISTSSNAGDGGDIFIVAGANLTSTGPPSGANDTTSTVTVTGPSLPGGSINFAGVAPVSTINSSSSATNGSGGNITLVAFSGAASGSGTISLPTGAPILTGGNGAGTNGNVTIIAGAPFGNSINTGSISTTGGAAGSGNIQILAATPQISSGGLLILNGQVVSGFVGAGAPQNGTINNVGLNAAGTVLVRAGTAHFLPSTSSSVGTFTINATVVRLDDFADIVATGPVQINTGGVPGPLTIITANSGSSLIAASGSINIATVGAAPVTFRPVMIGQPTELLFGGALTVTAGSVTVQPDVTLDSFDNITVNATSLTNNGTIRSTAAGNGGNINIFSTSGLTIAGTGAMSADGANGSGGSIQLQATSGSLNIGDQDISANATSNGNGGNISLSAQSLVPTGLSPLTLSANGDGTGNGGSVNVTTTNATSDLTLGAAAGNLAVNARAGSVGSSAGNGGTITISAGRDLLVDPFAFGIGPQGNNGDGGSITLTSGAAGAGNLFIDDSLDASGLGTGDGGSIQLTNNSGIPFTIAVGTTSNGVSGAITANGGGSGRGGTITITNNGSGGISIGDDLTADGASGGTITITSNGSGGISIGGDITADGASGGTITISSTATGDIIRIGTGTLTSGAITLFANAVNIGSSANRILTTADLLTVNAVAAGTDVFVAEADAVELTGSSSAGGTFDLQAGGSLTISENVTAGTSIVLLSSAGNITVLSGVTLASDNITVNAGLSTNNGTITSGPGLFDVNGSLSSAGTISVGSGGMNVGGSSLTIDGAFANGGMLTFDGGTQTFTSDFSAAAYGMVTIAGGATVTLLGTDDDFAMSVLTISSGGSLDATNQTLTLTGAGTAIFNSGTLTATGSTFIYQGSVSQVVTANIAYNNLSINNAAGVSLAGDTTATGVLNLATDLSSGSFTFAMPASGSSTGTGDVIGNFNRTGFTLGTALSFGNPLNAIRFDSGTVPTAVNVNLVKETPAGFPANTVSRTYTITPTGGSSFSATLRLRYKDEELSGLSETTLELWRHNGASWASPAGSATRDTVNNSVEESAVTQFSPWAIAGSSGPTLVEFAGATATGYDNGTLIEWQTGFEVDNLGFNIYREEGGKRALVNTELIAGSALVAGASVAVQSGESYAWWDSGIADCGSRIGDCKNAAYWLEDVDLSGRSTWHGPFLAQQVEGDPPARSQAERLSKIGLKQSQGASSRSVEALASTSLPSFEQTAQQSQLSSRPTVKIAVKREGFYRVAQPELVREGLSAKVDPRLLQLFVEGREVPFIVSTGPGGLFDETAAIEFYGMGLDTPATDERAYWLVVGDKEGKRISNVEEKGLPASSDSFSHSVERKDRSIYFAALRNGDRENFFGAVVTPSPVDQTLDLPNVHKSAFEQAALEVALQGVTGQPHRALIELNGSQLGEVVFSNQEQGIARFALEHSTLREGGNTVRLVSVNGPGDVSLVDYLRINYQHAFTADHDALRLRVPGNEGVTIRGFSSKAIRVFDVTDEAAVAELRGEVAQAKDGYSITVASAERGERTLLALTDDDLSKPAAVKANLPSSWQSSRNRADFVIIAPRDFFSALEPLSIVRQSQGYKVALVDIEDVYDEFNFGNKSSVSIKDFLRFARSSWQVKPSFVMFAGDASYDARNYLGLGSGDMVPTRLVDTAFLETASDDWLADFDNDGIADVAVGRLPVRSADEAAAVVAKLIGYESSRAAESALLISDENDSFDFEQASEQLRPILEAKMRVERLQRGRVDPTEARAQLIDAISHGQKGINYIGHGSANAWRANLLTSAEARELSNEALPLMVMMSCLNGYFHDSTFDSLAESLIKAERGGAVAAWASSGITFPQQQAVMNHQLYRLLFGTGDKGLRLGEAAVKAKQAVGDLDIRRTWILLGDPSMRVR